MKPKVYIETTIPSFYFETRGDARAQTWRDVTREWWDAHRHRYDLFASRFVLRELADAPPPKASNALELMDETTILSEPTELADVIQYYMEHKLMPIDAYGDAAHLAMASLHSMEFLRTWNCRHLANANKSRHIAVLNGRLGLPAPVITTPMMLLPEDE